MKIQVKDITEDYPLSYWIEEELQYLQYMKER